MADPKRPRVPESELIDVIWRAASAETLSAGDWLDLAADDDKDDDEEDDDDEDDDEEDEEDDEAAEDESET